MSALIPMGDRKVSARELRRRLNAEAAFQHTKVVPALNAALNAEQATRQRVDAIESFLKRGFWDRMRWLLMGR